jgi:type 1 glutamine amidotransferase
MKLLTLIGLLAVCGFASAADPWLVVEPAGSAKGKNIVLISGDEEYRSEEMLPQLAKILAKHHGFKCTVLFAINPKDGTINPNQSDNIPGLEALDSADLMVIFTRFRRLPDEQMKHIVDYVEAGKPIIGLRTATHAFDPKPGTTYAKWRWNSKEWDGGFGRQVLGETWINHHGNHGKQSTRGIIAPGEANHPILRGIKDGDIWGTTDVYGVRLPMSSACTPLVLGQSLAGMKPTDPPAPGKVNDPMMPIAWTKMYKSGRTFTCTLAAAQDLENEGLRRLLVNACYWTIGLEVPERAVVDLIGTYRPSPFKGDGFKKGVRPSDLADK